MARKDWFDHGYKMTDDPAYKEMLEIEEWLAAGDLEQLEFASQVVDSFPQHRDGYFDTPWIVRAIDCGRVSVVKWMIEKGVNLRLGSTDAYPPVLACIDSRDSEEKYQILGALIASGADINERGINGWTPLHLAALKDDEKSMHMLLVAGADRSITTLCDDDATAEEEARKFGHIQSAEYIARFASD